MEAIQNWTKLETMKMQKAQLMKARYRCTLIGLEEALQYENFYSNDEKIQHTSEKVVLLLIEGLPKNGFLPLVHFFIEYFSKNYGSEHKKKNLAIIHLKFAYSLSFAVPNLVKMWKKPRNCRFIQASQIAASNCIWMLLICKKKD